MGKIVREDNLDRVILTVFICMAEKFDVGIGISESPYSAYGSLMYIRSTNYGVTILVGNLSKFKCTKGKFPINIDMGRYVDIEDVWQDYGQP